MDVAPRVDRLLSKAVNEQLREQRMIRKALEDVADRLEQVEAVAAALEEKINPWSDPGAATADLAVRVEKRMGKRLNALEARIDEMTETVEDQVVQRVSADVAAVADELRKAVADLARLLVRDRGRITGILTEHRNAIVAEMRLPPDAPAAPRNGNGRPTLRRLDLTDIESGTEPVIDDDDDADGYDEEPEVESALEAGRRILRRRRGA